MSITVFLWISVAIADMLLPYEYLYDGYGYCSSILTQNSEIPEVATFLDLKYDEHYCQFTM